MKQFLPFFIICFYFILGIAGGKFLRLRKFKVVPMLLKISLYFLLFFMGLRIGQHPEIKMQWSRITSYSVLFALSTTFGTVIALYLMLVFQKSKNESERKIAEKTKNNNSIKSFFEPLSLLSVVIIGFYIGFSKIFILNFNAEKLSSGLLYFLLFLIGIETARSKVKILKTLLNKESILIPLGTVIGSLLGGFILSIFIKIEFSEGLSVSSGFGWYSLSGVLITNLGNPFLGSIGFLANILREAFALILIPFLGRLKHPGIAIGVGGATSMDVTLPLIQRVFGPSVVSLSIINGVILSILVPILVPLFYNFGF